MSNTFSKYSETIRICIITVREAIFSGGQTAIFWFNKYIFISSGLGSAVQKKKKKKISVFFVCLFVGALVFCLLGFLFVCLFWFVCLFCFEVYSHNGSHCYHRLKLKNNKKQQQNRTVALNLFH